jgi:hypothetical protein
MSPRSGSHERGRVRGSNCRFERALVSRRAEDCGEAFGPVYTRASRALTAPFGGQLLTDTMVERRSLSPSSPWAGRVARVDRAARVAKGQRGAAIDVSAQAGLLFQPAPRLIRCNDFKRCH